MLVRPFHKAWSISAYFVTFLWKARIGPLFPSNFHFCLSRSRTNWLLSYVIQLLRSSNVLIWHILELCTLFYLGFVQKRKLIFEISFTYFIMQCRWFLSIIPKNLRCIKVIFSDNPNRNWRKLLKYLRFVNIVKIKSSSLVNPSWLLTLNIIDDLT